LPRRSAQPRGGRAGRDSRSAPLALTVPSSLEARHPSGVPRFVVRNTSPMRRVVGWVLLGCAAALLFRNLFGGSSTGAGCAVILLALVGLALAGAGNRREP